jgi:propionyl-CoA synthetase
MASYAETHGRSLRDPEGFWGEIAEGIHWERRWTRVLDASHAPFYRWFPGGRLNTCFNALDRHVEAGRGAQAALIYDSPMTGEVRSFTFAELRDAVARFAGALARLGVAKGDRVVIYMPMVPEAVIAMLASARIGAIHSVVFGGFAARELATRLDDAQPKVIVAASCGLEPGRIVPYKPLLDEAIGLASAKPERCITAATSTGRRRRPQQSPWTACRSRRPIPSTSSTPPAPPASPRAWCATMAAMPSRSPGP